MENASRALIMAAGILIGIIILSIFVYEMYYVSDTGNRYKEAIAESVILEFNSQIEEYENRELTAQDIVTIYNYITEWNGNNSSDTITIKYVKTTGATDNALKSAIESGNETFLNSKSNATFSMTVVSYAETGRINQIKICQTS